MDFAWVRTTEQPPSIFSRDSRVGRSVELERGTVSGSESRRGDGIDLHTAAIRDADHRDFCFGDIRDII